MSQDKPRFIRRNGRIIPIGGKSKGGKGQNKNKYFRSAEQGAMLGAGQTLSMSLAKTGRLNAATLVGFGASVGALSKLYSDIKKSESVGDFAKLFGSGVAGSYLSVVGLRSAAKLTQQNMRKWKR